MSDYSFTSAYISAKETSILNKDALSRITSDKRDAVRTLAQTGYGGAGGGDVSALVDKELSALRKFVIESLPDTLYPLLILPYDAHNLKVLLKCCVNGADPKPYLYDNTVFDTEIAAACCRGGEFSLLSDHIASLLDPAYDKGMLNTPFGISTECDRAFYSEMARRAIEAPDPAKDYIKAETDGKNFISYFRAKNTGLDKDTFKAVLLPGGSVPESILLKAYEAAADDLREYTFGYACHDAFCAAADKLKVSLSEVCDVLDSYAYSVLEPYKYEPESFASVFIYFKEKTAEARHVREAFAGQGGIL